MTFSPFTGRRLRLAAACTALLLAACGGGTSQQQSFEPQRLIVLGDETSFLGAGGAKYSPAAVVTTTTGGTTTERVDCTGNPIWVQGVASAYGFVFAECNPSAVASPQALMRAAPGARVADLTAQIDAQVAAGGFREKDLVTVLAGANDVLAAYAQFPARSEADLVGEMRQRGAQLAAAVNRVVALGGRVVVSTMPDMGLTPFAQAQKAAFSDTDRAVLLGRLSAALNEQLGVNVLLDGRFVGLVQADLSLQAMVRSPASFGLANVTEAACQPAAPLPQCTDKTLVTVGTTPANAASWLWADAQRFGLPLHLQLASLAVDRARRNPF